MPFTKQITAPNGVSLQFHQVLRYEIGRELTHATAHVGGWPDEAAYLAGHAPAWTAVETVALPQTVLSQLDDALLASPAFSGATPVPDAAGGISTVKARAWAGIKYVRGVLEFGGFTWDNSAFDSDAQAQARIQGGVQLATIAAANNQPFSIDWTLADNSVRTLSSTEMVTVGFALAAHVQAVHTTARTLRSQIEAATTVAEVEAVTWPD